MLFRSGPAHRLRPATGRGRPAADPGRTLPSLRGRQSHGSPEGPGDGTQARVPARLAAAPRHRGVAPFGWHPAEIQRGAGRAGRPDLILLDEPYQGFDEDSYLIFRSQLLRWRDRGAGILMITHMLHDLDDIDHVKIGRAHV